MQALLGYLKTNPHDHKLYLIKLKEFIKIANSLRYEILETIVQTNEKINSAYLFGKGKVQEIKQKIKEKGIEAFIIYNTLNSIQRINLEDSLNVKIVDKYDLILEIFEKNAGDKLTKLQIELARIQREIPYVKKRYAFKLFTDRPGPRSLGEYAYHKIISQLVSRKKRIKEEIEYYKRIKEEQIRKRKEIGFKIVTLCGFYNAGKTCLFNSLTNLRKPILDIPFTTLSSKYYLVRKSNIRFLIVDTIGFTFDIDPLLIESFDATLKDIRNSDLILLVIDSSDNEILFVEKIKTSLNILNKLEIDYNKIIPILNKIDLIDKNDFINKIKIAENYFKNEIIYVSALEKYNLNLLIKKIENFI